MTISYLLPQSGNFATLTEEASRVGVEVFSPQKLRELIVLAESGNILVSTVSSSDLQIIARHTSALFAEMPSVVLNVPGLIYPGDWMTSAAMFPPIDWLELSRKWAKSGVTAYDTDSAGKRDTGAPIRTEKVDFSEEEPISFGSSDSDDDIGL